MKKLINIFCVLLIVCCGFYNASAQTKADKKAAKAAALNKMIADKNYLFNATYVTPLKGGGHALTSEYDLTISKDTISAYLPYFGQAYLADYDSNDGGIKFKWVNFEYKETNSKKGHEILITPKDKNIGNAKAVQSIRLYISPDGYATLQITSYNRDPISFYGDIEQKTNPEGS